MNTQHICYARLLALYIFVRSQLDLPSREGHNWKHVRDGVYVYVFESTQLRGVVVRISSDRNGRLYELYIKMYTRIVRVGK